MQAQDYGPAKWSIGQRARGLVNQDLDRALAAGSIVRTHVLRPTWHFVAADDIRWLLALTGPRVQRHLERRYLVLELDEKTRARSEVLVASALEGGTHLTRDTIAAVLNKGGIDTSGQRLPHLLLHCELESVICSGGLSGKQQTYALLDERVPRGGSFDRDISLVELARRYLTSHGPATMQDLRWWSSLTVADIKKALHMLGSEVQSETLEGFTFWSMVTGSKRSRSPCGLHLLQAYDEVLVGYTQSRYFGDPREQAARAAWKDRSLPTGVVLLNGGVAGHWRRTMVRDTVRVEALLYEDLQSADARALETAARRLGRFLSRPLTVETARLYLGGGARRPRRAR
jgi:hypothetical protein